MFNKDIKFDNDAREELLMGINTLANAVKVTFGPQGNCVVIADVDKQPRVTKDGVSVAKEIQLDDPYKNVGAQLIKEAALKTVNAVGDATTTSTILAQELVNELNKQLSQGESPIVLKQKLNNSLEQALVYIKSKTIPIEDKDIENIATISANNDKEIGKLIGDAFKTIGRDGVITVEESPGIDTRVSISKGMQFDKGYVAQHFVTDYAKDVCVLDNPYILITDHKIQRLKDLQFVLSQVITEGRSILLIAEDFDDSVVETLKLNKLNGTLKVCAIKAPSFGEYRETVLNSIAILTGGTFVSYESGLEISDVTIGMLGSCAKVTVTKDKTTIVGGNGDPNNINKEIELIRKTISDLNQDPSNEGSFVLKFYKELLAKLTGGIAVIYVGGVTDLERGERRDRVDDAVAATKAAIEEGVVLGGGLTYYYAGLSILNDIPEEEQSEALIDTLPKIIKLLIESTGEDPNEILIHITEKIGFDANTKKCVDMYQAGIIDPAKAVRVALENAVSVANLFLSTQCVIVPILNNQIIM